MRIWDAVRWRCLRSLAPRIPLPWIPASARMTNSVARDNDFRTNRPCRLPPAHQGMKIGAPVGRSSLRWLGTRVGRWPAWGWGQAPALHFSLPAGDEPQLEQVSGPAIFVPMTAIARGLEGKRLSYQNLTAWRREWSNGGEARVTQAGPAHHLRNARTDPGHSGEYRTGHNARAAQKGLAIHETGLRC